MFRKIANKFFKKGKNTSKDKEEPMINFSQNKILEDPSPARTVQEEEEISSRPSLPDIQANYEKLLEASRPSLSITSTNFLKEEDEVLLDNNNQIDPAALIPNPKFQNKESLAFSDSLFKQKQIAYVIFKFEKINLFRANSPELLMNIRMGNSSCEIKLVRVESASFWSAYELGEVKKCANISYIDTRFIEADVKNNCDENSNTRSKGKKPTKMDNENPSLQNTRKKKKGRKKSLQDGDKKVHAHKKSLSDGTLIMEYSRSSFLYSDESSVLLFKIPVYNSSSSLHICILEQRKFSSERLVSEWRCPYHFLVDSFIMPDKSNYDCHQGDWATSYAFLLRRGYSLLCSLIPKTYSKRNETSALQKAWVELATANTYSKVKSKGAFTEEGMLIHKDKRVVVVKSQADSYFRERRLPLWREESKKGNTKRRRIKSEEVRNIKRQISEKTKKEKPAPITVARGSNGPRRQGLLEVERLTVEKSTWKKQDDRKEPEGILKESKPEILPSTKKKLKK